MKQNLNHFNYSHTRKIIKFDMFRVGGIRTTNEKSPPLQHATSLMNVSLVRYFKGTFKGKVLLDDIELYVLPSFLLSLSRSFYSSRLTYINQRNVRNFKMVMNEITLQEIDHIACRLFGDDHVEKRREKNLESLSLIFHMQKKRVFHQTSKQASVLTIGDCFT